MIDILKKILLSKPFFNDGIEYQFIDIEEPTISYHSARGQKLYIDAVIKVNVVLPKKGQSYILEVIEQNIDKIIHNLFKYTGTKIKYKLNILVDGKEPLSVFISDEKIKEITESISEIIKIVRIENYNIYFNISLYPHRKNFYAMDDNYFDINFLYKINNIFNKGKKVILKDEFLDEFAGNINEYLMESDEFREDLQDILYNILEPELKIYNSDVYIQPNYYIHSIDGIEVHPQFKNFEGEINPDMFI